MENQQQYEEKAIELAKKYNVTKVHVYVAEDPKTKKKVVGYMKEPSYAQKIYAMDKFGTVGIFTAGEELREALTLKEESDPRTYSENPENDSFRLGMTTTATAIIEIATNEFKKK